MKTFKIIDLLVSITLIAGYLIAECWKDVELQLQSYFVVGGWQVISMIVHKVKNYFTKPKGIRSVYHWITVFSLLTMPLGSVWILYFTAPIMALFYCLLCFYEIRKMVDRPIAVLK